MRIRILSSVPLALLAACSATLCLDSRWSQLYSLEVDPKSESHRIVLDCPTSAGVLRAHFRIDGASGGISLRLFDPAGIERHREDVHGGRCDVTQHWPARRGVWVVDLVATDFAGSYAVDLCSSDHSCDAADGLPADAQP